ncbi:MAG TPA: PDZ domain-containing protein [Thermoanaerobaculia bacterium]|jgi:S1-C subfamily serine protease
MKRKISLLALALILALSSAALAGGEKCAHESQAAHKEKAAKMAAHGWLGLKTEKDAAGAWRVASVAQGSPAAQAGFRAGDVLVAFNGIALTEANKDAVKKAKYSLGVGKQVAYTVRRDGAERTLTATLAPVPDEVLAEWMKEEEKTAQMANKQN